MIDRTTGSRVGYAGTSAPSRVVEYSSKGASGVREYTLTPEELEEVRQKYPASKRDKAFKKPVAHNPREDQRQREDEEMTGQRMSKEGPSSGLTKQIFLEQIASGETVASVEKAWGMKYNTLSFWVKKWELKGINAAKAQELLAGSTPKETQLLREKEALPPQPPVNLPEMYKKALQEIEELKAALSVTQPISHDMLKEYKASGERLAVENAELRAELDQTITARDEYKRLYVEQYEFAQEYFKQVELLTARADGAVSAREAAELDLDQAESRCRQYAETIDALATECDGLQAELNRLITERDAWTEQEEVLLTEIAELREAAGHVPEPASEVHLLDRSIAELTRAKWILNRLSASGE